MGNCRGDVRHGRWTTVGDAQLKTVKLTSAH